MQYFVNCPSNFVDWVLLTSVLKWGKLRLWDVKEPAHGKKIRNLIPNWPHWGQQSVCRYVVARGLSWGSVSIASTLFLLRSYVYLRLCFCKSAKKISSNLVFYGFPPYIIETKLSFSLAVFEASLRNLNVRTTEV